MYILYFNISLIHNIIQVFSRTEKWLRQQKYCHKKFSDRRQVTYINEKGKVHDKEPC